MDQQCEGVVDPEVIVWCPYCGSEVEILIDPEGGAVQKYVEDCAICCQPWQLTVYVDPEGGATVEARTEEE